MDEPDGEVDAATAGLCLTGLDLPAEIVREIHMVQAPRPLGGSSGRRLTVGVDSGAARTVLPKDQLTDYPLEANEMSSRGGCYWTASGNRVPDLGTRRLFGTVGKSRVGLRASAADVTKALASVADMVDNGYTILFSRDHSFAVSPKRPASDQRIDFVRRNRVYEFDMEVEPHGVHGLGRSGFHRPAARP